MPGYPVGVTGRTPSEWDNDAGEPPSGKSGEQPPPDPFVPAPAKPLEKAFSPTAGPAKVPEQYMVAYEEGLLGVEVGDVRYAANVILKSGVFSEAFKTRARRILDILKNQ